VEDCLFEGSAPTDSMFCPSVEGLAVLPARGGSQNVAQILSSANLTKMLDELKRLHAGCLLVLDLPPVADGADATAFQQVADALLVVVEDGVTTEREFRRVVSAITPAKLLGTVLNRAEAAA
jgi:Mrp family chromosome partitioning ATPase